MELHWLHLHNWCNAEKTCDTWCTSQTSCKSINWKEKQIHLGRSEFFSSLAWRQITIIWFKLSYGITHSAAMQKLHSIHRSKVGMNNVATNNSIFEFTPFLLFEADVLTDLWVEANACYTGQLHLLLKTYGSALSSQSYNFRCRHWLQKPSEIWGATAYRFYFLPL